MRSITIIMAINVSNLINNDSMFSNYNKVGFKLICLSIEVC